MATALFALLRKLAALVMLIAVSDLLLPDGSMRRYARLVGGLMTMLLLASPLLGWLSEVAG
ncbi:MAG: stage III sporulation protein AF [Oscillospiraceae bacterium]|jgi:stage III sporulation protein AF|nr:stage III sporulation protein AF [Oscillospiraceae bacterium]